MEEAARAGEAQGRECKKAGSASTDPPVLGKQAEIMGFKSAPLPAPKNGERRKPRAKCDLDAETNAVGLPAKPTFALGAFGRMGLPLKAGQAPASVA